RPAAAARVSRYRRIPGAGPEQAAPSPNPGAEARDQRAGRSRPAGSGAAGGTRGILRGQARIPRSGRPCGVRHAAVSRAHRLAPPTPPAFLRARRMTSIAPEIFKAYDVRGIVDKTLTEPAAESIGRGLGTMA